MVTLKRLHIYLFLFAFVAFAACEVVDETTLPSEEEVVLVDMSFMATIDDETGTKTALDGTLEDDNRKVLWQPDDRIGLVGVTSSSGVAQIYELINIVSEPSESVVFTGPSPIASTYWAIYPYDSDSSGDLSKGTLVFDLPSVQKYVEGSFDPDSTPMVAKAAQGKPLCFKNLCGLLALQLTGEIAVESIVFIGRDSGGKNMPVCGTYSVDMNYESVPEITRILNSSDGTSGTYVTLQCDVPVQLKTDEAVPFYIVLPPATYDTFVVMITTSDGDVMIREGRNPLTIKRSDVQPTDNLGYAENVYVDLSERGTSNCYIVSEPGLYSFDATVIGNGDFGLVYGEAFHTDNTKIEPSSVELLWEDSNSLIRNIAYGDGKVTFIATGTEGNALIAVKDAEGSILWSWHIWITDQPKDQTYENDVLGEFIMLDRNVGAIRADRGTGDEWQESIGLHYQWGRKDPLVQGKINNYYNQLTAGEAIKYPTYFINSSPWTSETSVNYWHTEQKTMYDPCPVGYRMPPEDVWYGFTDNGASQYVNENHVASTTFDNGYWFYCNSSSEVAWYPASGYFTSAGGRSETSYGYAWSANKSGGSGYRIGFNNNGYVYQNQTNSMFFAFPVRCMKDEGYVDTSYPYVTLDSITDITSDSAVINCNVRIEGISPVTERGIIYSTESDFSVDAGVKLTSESLEESDYSITLEGLDHSTRYYVRAYAINERGAYYSEEKAFYTPYSGNAVDLSANGTANCYIVPPVYSSYEFDCTVKGNSEESVGTPESAAVLWESRLNTNVLETGCVVESVALEDGKVKFMLPFDTKPGNALIAVKDADGNILWSWHIWVVDFDPVQTGQVYYSGNMLMDRNLGALDIIPSSSDYGAYGLFYQWGRKDPFLIPDRGTTVPVNAITAVYEDLSSIDLTVPTPTVVYDNSYWGEDATLWGPVKTIYDPCPPGWKVPDRDVWDRIQKSHLTNVNSTYRIIPEPYAVPQAYYPMAGEGDGWNSQIVSNFNSSGRWWIAEINSGRSARNLYMHWNGDFNFSVMDVDQRCSVRCMKEAYFEVITGEVFNIKGTSFEVTGEFTSDDGTEITEAGFVISEVDPLTAVDRMQVASQSVDSPFTMTISNLKSKTKYYVRAYAKCGRNIKYGEVISLTTNQAANSEGYVEGEFEW